MVAAIIQARMGSTRFPGKVLKNLNGTPALEFIIKRLKRIDSIKEIIVATTIRDEDNAIEDLVKKLGEKIYRGSTDNVLSRFYYASLELKSETIIRITADCPFVDPEVITKMIRLFKENNVDYLSNTMEVTFPDGLDVEIFPKKSLKDAFLNCEDKQMREHVTPWLIQSKTHTKYSFKNDYDYSSLRLTIDEPEDLKVINSIIKQFPNDYFITFLDLVNLFKKSPEIFALNQHLKRNEGEFLNKGTKLWKRAKNIIPGGNMLLSKRADMFLPEKWPAYFSSAKGCKIWDLDGNEYTDMSIMGIGTNILGYGNKDVDEAVIKTVSAGNMSTFNCPEEVKLAEKLIEIHPWADMVKLARTGGEANSIAIRIARASTGKDKVAICGYHGWHDWYLASNLDNSSNLDEHLLAGLNPVGVPSGLKGSVLPFQYNDLKAIKKIINNNELAAIKMEVERSEPPNKKFLESIRKLCSEKGIVLIFDECTSGFRETYGGIHKKYGVNPDIAIFGKSLGNGYAITAIIGKENVMEAAQDSFISSTFWTERIGPTAALKTLEIMKKEKSWEKITQIGLKIKNGWGTLANTHKIEIIQSGIPALAGFNFKSSNSLSYKTLITQEMLKKKILASNLFYASISHKEELINNYFELLDNVFTKIAKCENGYLSIEDLLESPVCISGFQRLN